MKTLIMRAGSLLSVVPLSAVLSTTVLAQQDATNHENTRNSTAQVTTQPTAQVPIEEQRQALLEEVVVTGSLIRGTPEDAALPVDVLTSEEMTKLGSPSAVELIKALPVSSGVIGDTNQFDSKAQATEGMASVNLRGLSPQRTLVLLNSKRLVQAGTGVPFVDINLLPLSAIGRVEILKDGASATYGSDAIGGVVNFITRTDQEGFQLSGDYKYIEDADGDYSIAGSYGHQGDGIRFFLAADVQHRSELLANERDFAIQPYEKNPEGGWTGGGNPATYLPLGFVPGVGVTPIAGLRPDPDCQELGGYVTAQSRCATQYTPFDALVEEEDRMRVYTELDFDLTDDINLAFSGLYGKTENPQYRSSPSYLLTRSPSASVGGSSSGFVVPGSNPGFQQLVAENPGAVPAGSVAALFPTLLFRPFMVGGNPMFEDDPDSLGAQTGDRVSESMRFTAELNGKFTENLSFQGSLMYHEYERYYDGWDAFGDRVQQALNGYGGPNCDLATPGSNGCSWFNPFGNAVTGTGPDNNDPELLRWMFGKSTTEITTDLFVAEFAVSGETGWSLSGGDVLFGAGVQYRDNGYSSKYGENNNLSVYPCPDTPVNGSTACDPAIGALGFLGSNYNGDYESDVWAIFGEVQLPITDNLSVQLAARFEEYGGETGSTFDPKLTARWQITDGLALRGSVSTTFRGPPPQQLTNAGVTSLQVIANSFRPVDVTGNEGLKPESSLNYSMGVMFEKGGFSGSVDVFTYEIEDSIGSEPLSGMVDTMFDDPANCTDSAYDGLRERFQFNDGGGVPGAGTCSVSNISRVRTSWVNGGERNFSGLDFIFNYRADSVWNGYLGAGVTATYMIEAEVGEETVEGIVVQDTFDSVGQLNFQTSAYPVPEWKGQAYLEWGRDRFNARLTVNYSDGYYDQRADDTDSGPFRTREDIAGNPVLMQGANIKSMTTADLNFLLDLRENLTMSFTVINLTDEEPSFARLDYNYDPFIGNALGRQYKLGFTARF